MNTVEWSVLVCHPSSACLCVWKEQQEYWAEILVAKTKQLFEKTRQCPTQQTAAIWHDGEKASEQMERTSSGSICNSLNGSHFVLFSILGLDIAAIWLRLTTIGNVAQCECSVCMIVNGGWGWWWRGIGWWWRECQYTIGLTLGQSIAAKVTVRCGQEETLLVQRRANDAE